MKRAAPPPSFALEGAKQLLVKRVRSQGEAVYKVNVPLDSDVAGVKQQLEAAGGPKKAQASLVYSTCAWPAVRFALATARLAPYIHCPCGHCGLRRAVVSHRRAAAAGLVDD